MRPSVLPRRLAIYAALVLLPCAMAAQAEPVPAPNDLIIGRISYSQNGQNVRQLLVGTPVAITCNYFVNEVPNLFLHLQPWRGTIQIGGAAPRTLDFQGIDRGGGYEARQIWTPSAAGKTPIGCVLNPGFENAEANAGNNRFDEVIDVVGDGDAPPSADNAAPPPADNAAPAPVGDVDRHPPGIRALADRGRVLTDADPKAAALRDQMLYGFNIGMGGTEGNTLWGPGQQARLNSLTPAEQAGYKVASTYMLDRNRNAKRAATGQAIDVALVKVAPTSCRDFVIGNGEQCDDGNMANGDGCSSACQREE